MQRNATWIAWCIQGWACIWKKWLLASVWNLFIQFFSLNDYYKNRKFIYTAVNKRRNRFIREGPASLTGKQLMMVISQRPFKPHWAEWISPLHFCLRCGSITGLNCPLVLLHLLHLSLLHWTLLWFPLRCTVVKGLLCFYSLKIIPHLFPDQVGDVRDGGLSASRTRAICYGSINLGSHREQTMD